MNHEKLQEILQLAKERVWLVESFDNDELSPYVKTSIAADLSRAVLFLYDKHRCTNENYEVGSGQLCGICEKSNP